MGSEPLSTIGLRLTRAELARAFKVSRAAVSQWVAAGKLEVGDDDRIDYAEAVAWLVTATPPERLRSRWLRHAASLASAPRQQLDAAQAEVAQLRAELARLRGELADAQAAAADARAALADVHQAGRWAERDDVAERLADYLGALEARFAEGVAAHARGGLGEWLDQIASVVFYGAEVDVDELLDDDDAPVAEPPEVPREVIPSRPHPTSEVAS